MENLEAFWNQVDKNGSNGCWVWIGPIHDSKNSVLYGQVQWRIDRERPKAHRFSWMIHFGSIPKGMCICHACDNGLCVNPNHLWLGTRSANVTDMFRKGRNGYSGHVHSNNEKVESSARSLGVKKPWMLGANNPAKRSEVRQKIRELRMGDKNPRCYTTKIQAAMRNLF